MVEPKVPDQQLVERAILQVCSPILASLRTRSELHADLQAAVAYLSSNFALEAEIEYVLPEFRGGRNGRLDVVWKYGAIPVVAFELDSSHRQKSLTKLLAVNANLRFWVYFGTHDPESLARSVDPSGLIHVIHIPSSLPTTQTGATGGGRSADGSIRREESGNTKRFAGVRQDYPKAYEPWTPEEDALLQTRMKDGVAVSKLAKYFQRKPSAILSRLKRLGLS